MDIKTEIEYQEVRDCLAEMGKLLDDPKLKSMTAKELFNLFDMATSHEESFSTNLHLVLCYVKGGLHNYSKNGITRF